MATGLTALAGSSYLLYGMLGGGYEVRHQPIDPETKQAIAEVRVEQQRLWPFADQRVVFSDARIPLPTRDPVVRLELVGSVKGTAVLAFLTQNGEDGWVYAQKDRAGQLQWRVVAYKEEGGVPLESDTRSDGFVAPNEY